MRNGFTVYMRVSVWYMEDEATCCGRGSEPAVRYPHLLAKLLAC